MTLNRSIFTSRCFFVGVMLLLVARAYAEPAVPRVRPLDARTASLMTRGCRESPTFAALIAWLQQSDAIVHVQARHPELGRAAGETRLAVRSGGVRYLRIVIDASLNDESAVALLGHELHHAWEIAQAPWVTDEPTLVQLYAQIGHIHEHDGARRADSSGAREAGTRVLAELRFRRSAARPHVTHVKIHAETLALAARTVSVNRIVTCLSDYREPTGTRRYVTRYLASSCQHSH